MTKRQKADWNCSYDEYLVRSAKISQSKPKKFYISCKLYQLTFNCFKLTPYEMLSVKQSAFLQLSSLLAGYILPVSLKPIGLMIVNPVDSVNSQSTLNECSCNVGLMVYDPFRVSPLSKYS